MTPNVRRLLLCAACAAVSAVSLQSQGREWTTAAFDAQHTAWLRRDARLTKDAVLHGQFKWLWKAKLDNTPRQMNSLTTPILLDQLIGYRGFKSLAFVGGSDDRVFAIDTDLARPYWTAVLNYSANAGGQPSSTPECPGGLIAAPTRRTPLAPPSLGPTGASSRGGARNASDVGEPGRGAAVLSRAAPRGGGPAQGRGTSAGATPTSRPAGGRPPVTPIPFGGVEPVFAVASDGLLHTLRSSNGSDAEPPAPFLPPSAKPSSLVWIDGVVYATTSGECGAAPNGVWAIDLTSKEQKPITVWKTGGGSVAGADGPAFGADGTLYVAVARGPAESRFSSSVVALDRGTLQPRDWLTVAGADFNVSPTVFTYKDKEYLTVTDSDGRLYLLDGASPGGADHNIPLYVTPKQTGGIRGGALATWEDGSTRWIVAAGSNGITAFRVAEDAGKVTLQRAWKSAPLVSPLAPVVVNGMVFAVTQGAHGSMHAVLYVLDASTGKTLWNSGTTITSVARAGLSAGGGQVYLVTYDNHLYAFGVPMEH